MSETMMKVMFADEICEMPCEEKNGIYYPKADSYGRKDMSILALKALDLMAELDRTVLQCINMSGLLGCLLCSMVRRSTTSGGSLIDLVWRPHSTSSRRTTARFSAMVSVRLSISRSLHFRAMSSPWRSPVVSASMNMGR